MPIVNPVTGEQTLTFKEAAIEMMKLKVSEPVSAWNLMDWACNHAKEEPRRLVMTLWGEFCTSTVWDDNNNPGFELRNSVPDRVPGDEGRVDPRSVIPPCGTHACVAGWIHIRLTGKMSGDILGVALSSLLTGDTRLDKEIFINKRLTLGPNQGTVEHADMVIAEVRKFMRDHEKLLKSRIVGPEYRLVDSGGIPPDEDYWTVCKYDGIDVDGEYSGR